MRSCKLDGRQRSKRAVLRKLARDLGFPAHFGGNLDALHDVLTRDVKGPLRITWRATASVRQGLGADLAALQRTLEDAAAEREDLLLDLS